VLLAALSGIGFVLRISMLIQALSSEAQGLLEESMGNRPVGMPQAFFLWDQTPGLEPTMS
ncbi:hypothetical protein, partial [Pseudomonas sp. UBA4102]|uniref:hypothetical protein n=1 Tax=Pseudomonas sp. UBA4102 TaxID=1947316 RepID=UPI00257B2833